MGKKNNSTFIKSKPSGSNKKSKNYLFIIYTVLIVLTIVFFFILYFLNKSNPTSIPLKQGTIIGVNYFPDGDTPIGGNGNVIDGIDANQMENIKYHIHAHLSLFYNGKQIAIPKGIGILAPRYDQNGFVTRGNGFYWLHTHDATGIIHVESPIKFPYTLGNFFDIWGEPLTSKNIAGLKGTIHIYTNGRQFDGDPRNLIIEPHEEITIEIGSPLIAPPIYTFADGL